ncbi:probable deoxyhypusine synthase isoform X2 [Dreissena polymorpha]|uniref:probable deoxyhypusine synthase isoform X2 n=1 Tax=Dreissena polymorpha TaxID=45954 RepID=UPI00226456C4|nr:probable deoxyhypusine synthase isoform X2 [Dreissena polymorpha]
MEKNPNENGNMPPSLATDAVLLKSEAIPNGTPIIKGYDFNEGLDYHRLLQTYMTSGFQAQNFGKAVEEINRMISCKLSPLSQEHTIECNSQQTYREKTNCTIFLSYTSNMISAGVREIIRFLVQHKMVDCIVTTAGGVEEDFIKCMAPTYMGDFNLSGRMLRDKGINRTGNLLVPNDNYCKFHDWMMPILDVMLEEQKSVGTLWTPSRMIDRLGKEINHPDSVYYWAHKNSIPVFSPALTDGSLGDQFFFHSFKKPGLVLDIIEDIRAINSIAIQSSNTGMIIVGAGLIKHHTCNANMMRNGADFAVYLNTSSEFDGSDSGASPDEAVSWGKIRKTATPVKICAEASLVFPLLIAETFVRRQQEFKNFRVTLAAEN